MSNCKKIIIALTIILGLGVTGVFAYYEWSSSATGSCTCGDTTFYPWSNWTQPEYGGTPENPDYDVISGEWNDGTFEGRYGGYKDSTTTVGMTEYKWYSGTWTLKVSETSQLNMGQFWLRVTTNVEPVTWNGEWWTTLQGCVGSGTMSGVLRWYPDP